jgi:hypothetical protein
MARLHAVTGTQGRRTVRIAGKDALLARRLKRLFAPGIIGLPWVRLGQTWRGWSRHRVSSPADRATQN